MCEREKEREGERKREKVREKEGERAREKVGVDLAPPKPPPLLFRTKTHQHRY